MFNDPLDYGLTHTSFRPHQREAIEWCNEIKPGQTGVLEAPTGSGKTGIARALASTARVISLCKTKNLQAENYGAKYKFDVLFGRGNYPCVHPDNPDAMADDCLYRDEGMNHCEYADTCPYLVAKRKAEVSRVASLNYSYWLTARWPRQSASGGVVVCDEAHELSDITLDHAGCTINPRQREMFDLPPFTIIRSKVGILSRESPTDKAIAWIARAVSAAGIALRKYEAGGNKKRARQAERLELKLAATHLALQVHGEDWYIASGPGVIPGERGGADQPGFVCRPLTARYHFAHYFASEAWRLLTMSATIGDPFTFAEELGLGARDIAWRSRNVPSVWPSVTRPVQVLDVPRMGHKASESDYLGQAEAIAQVIKQCPSEWAGLIHVTRKTEAKLLSQRLAHFGLGDRLWIPNESQGTDAQIAEWHTTRRRVKGAIAVSWSFWEGYNGLDERICIVAKTPFPYLGDPYERERMAYSSKFFSQRAAWKMEQGLGRVRRGRPQDYDLNGTVEKVVCIADSSYSRVQKYFSPALRESLVEA